MSASLLLLGTGASCGVPVIGCACEVCRSSLPENRRLRSAALLRVEERQVLIDAGPDLRMQALRWEIAALDGILFTHAHQDHTAGIDDLRIFAMRNKRPLPCLMSLATLEEIQLRFGYLFQNPSSPWLEPRLLPQEEGEIAFEGVAVRYFTYSQLAMPVNGYRVGDLAYVSDIRDYPESIFAALQGVRHLVISALRFSESKMHLTVDEAVAFAKRVGAEHAYLTHISHDLDYEKTNVYLPEKVRMAYDGMVINFRP